MTFSIAARDPLTGAFGMAVTSSSPAVAARCLHLRDGVGAVASQNVTDPRLGPTLLDQMQGGKTARQAMDAVLQAYPAGRYRQLTAIDVEGAIAYHSGAGTLGTHRVVTGAQVVAAGNLLSSINVPERMVEVFMRTGGEFEERLLGGLQAGEDAGGEEGDIRSCGLAVVHDVGWRVTDIRVDEEANPIEKLRHVLGVWLPQRDEYVSRALTPDQAPSFGVPGDL